MYIIPAFQCLTLGCGNRCPRTACDPRNLFVPPVTRFGDKPMREGKIFSATENYIDINTYALSKHKGKQSEKYLIKTLFRYIGLLKSRYCKKVHYSVVQTI